MLVAKEPPYTLVSPSQTHKVVVFFPWVVLVTEAHMLAVDLLAVISFASGLPFAIISKCIFRHCRKDKNLLAVSYLGNRNPTSQLHFP